MSITDTTTNRATPRRGTTNSRGKKAAATTGLDTYTNTCSTAGHKAKQLARERRERRLELGRRGYAVAGSKGRVKTCGTIPITLDYSVGLGITDRGNLSEVGLNRCGNRWCDRCWSKVAAHKGGEIAAVIAYEQALGNVCAVATLTASHATRERLAAADGNQHEAVGNQPLDELIALTVDAFAFMYRGRGGQALRAQEIGWTRASELTVDNLMIATSRTGAHWHFHILYVLKPATGKTAAEVVESYGEDLWSRWEHAVDKQGLAAKRQGFDIQLIDSPEDAADIAEYLTKGEKLPTDNGDQDAAAKAGRELTQAIVKNAKGEHRVSPEQVKRNIGEMDEAGMKDDRRMKRLIKQWEEIEKATHGRRWLEWSRGDRDLRVRAGLGEELPDEEIVQAEDAGDIEEVAVVNHAEVREHLDELKAVVAEVEGNKAQKMDVLRLALDSLGIDYQMEDVEAFNERVRHALRRRHCWDRGNSDTQLEAFQPEP